MLRDLLESKADFSVIVDSLPGANNRTTVRDFADCSRGDDRGLFGTPVLLEKVSGAEEPERAAQGRWIDLQNKSTAAGA